MTPARTIEIKPEHMDAILRVARQYYDYILLDVGRQIDAISLRALDGADVIYPILQLGLPDRFIDHGDAPQLLAACGLDATGIAASIRQRLGKTEPRLVVSNA